LQEWLELQGERRFLVDNKSVVEGGNNDDVFYDYINNLWRTGGDELLKKSVEEERIEESRKTEEED
jgi:hypothetical protein